MPSFILCHIILKVKPLTNLMKNNLYVKRVTERQFINEVNCIQSKTQMPIGGWFWHSKEIHRWLVKHCMCEFVYRCCCLLSVASMENDSKLKKASTLFH
jgi:hypothetical protein